MISSKKKYISFSGCFESWLSRTLSINLSQTAMLHQSLLACLLPTSLTIKKGRRIQKDLVESNRKPKMISQENIRTLKWFHLLQLTVSCPTVLRYFVSRLSKPMTKIKIYQHLKQVWLKTVLSTKHASTLSAEKYCAPAFITSLRPFILFKDLLTNGLVEYMTATSLAYTYFKNFKSSFRQPFLRNLIFKVTKDRMDLLKRIMRLVVFSINPRILFEIKPAL